MPAAKEIKVRNYSGLTTCFNETVPKYTENCQLNTCILQKQVFARLFKIGHPWGNRSADWK
jgi:hypothetical protein